MAACWMRSYSDRGGGVEAVGDVRVREFGEVSVATALFSQARRSSRPAARSAAGSALRALTAGAAPSAPVRFCTWWPYSCAST